MNFVKGMERNDETLLEEGPDADFQGATLQIHQDLNHGSRSPSSLGDDSESVAKLPLSPETTRESITHARTGRRNETDENSLKPAVSSGADIVSPITSIPRRISETLKKSRSKEKQHPCSDVICQTPILLQNDAKDFFTYRDGLVENAVKECVNNLISAEKDGEVLGTWLLTEISLWDNEKERLILLTSQALTTVKYDFIALKQLEFRKVPLLLVDTLVIGDLIYPSGSLVPSRNVRGLRAMWNRGEPLAFRKKWNPFNNEIPWTTYTSHPLLWHKEPHTEGNKIYDVEDFARHMVEAVERAQLSDTSVASPCRVEHKPIILQNYVGLSSLIHNRNALGFFKVRGKFSF